MAKLKNKLVFCEKSNLGRIENLFKKGEKKKLKRKKGVQKN